MKLYIGNLPWSVDEEALKKLFASYNPEEVSLIKDKFNGRSKGFGFVTIADEEVAKKAISEMNGKQVDGRDLKISEAKPLDPDAPKPRRSFSGGGRSFGGSRDGNRSGGRSFGGSRDGNRSQGRRF